MGSMRLVERKAQEKARGEGEEPVQVVTLIFKGDLAIGDQEVETVLTFKVAAVDEEQLLEGLKVKYLKDDIGVTINGHSSQSSSPFPNADHSTKISAFFKG